MATFIGAIKGSKNEARAKGRGSVKANKAIYYNKRYNELEKQKKIAKENGNIELFKKLHEQSEIALNNWLDNQY
jgi:hypothetical protein